MNIDEQVAIFLHIIAHNVKNRVMICRFYRSGETISRYFSRVCNVVIRLHSYLLKKPQPISEDSTDPRWKWFKNCLGALDGTYIRCLVSLEDKPRYRTRKGEIATNVLGVCSQDMQFIFVLPGWEGSAANGRVLREALDRPYGLKVPRPYYYLVDAGYTNGEGFLAPYRGQRYHLNDWRNGHQPTMPKELYNMKHSSARNVIERCFGILKARWGILRDNSYYPVDLKNKIIMACCLLHNFIRQEMPVDQFKTKNKHDEGTGDVGGGGVGNINSIGTSNEWTAFRDNLAENMTSQQKEHRAWTSVEDEKLVDALLTMKNTKGYKADNGFKPGYAMHLETLLKEALPDSGILAKPHIESRLKTMKQDWQVVYDMLNSTSGFGYDKEKNCVTNDSPGVWESYIKNHPKARKRANDAIDMENEAIKEQEQESEKDSDDAIDSSVQVEASSVRRKKKKKNMGHVNPLVKSFNDAVLLFGERLKESSAQLSEGIKLNVELKNKTSMLTLELEKMEEFTQLERFKVIRKMQSDPDSVITFWNLKEKERTD
nr:protein ALP1-like [Tanacetum cinerariifolium]